MTVADNVGDGEVIAHGAAGLGLHRLLTIRVYPPSVSGLGRLLRLERHRLGPRVYLCGLRIHEFVLGFAVLAVVVVGGLTETWELTHGTEVVFVFGAWLVGKDWRDLFPSKRDTAAWGFLPHRVPRD